MNGSIVPGEVPSRRVRSRRMDALVAVVARLLARPIAWAPALALPGHRVEFDLGEGISAHATPIAT
jgi:hypothetical protein